MKQQLSCILLIDDNEDDNFFHDIAIKKFDSHITVIAKEMSAEALDYLSENKNAEEKLPELIFLDINLPVINGWEFLKKFVAIKNDLAKEIRVILLTTSDNPDDIEKSKQWDDLVIDYYTKPLTLDKMKAIAEKHFVAALAG